MLCGISVPRVPRGIWQDQKKMFFQLKQDGEDGGSSREDFMEEVLFLPNLRNENLDV